MKAIQPEDQGYWLLTKGSTLYWQENNLPFGTAKELGLTTQKDNVAREMEITTFYGLWQKMIKMNENTFPYGVCCHYRLKIFIY